MPLRKESKRGLMALAVLSIVFTLGVAAFASLPSVSPSRAKDAVAARRTPAK